MDRLGPQRPRHDRAVRLAAASSTPRPSTGSPRSCAGRSSTASWSPARRCARWRWPTRSASPAPRSARRSAVLVAEGLATREPQPRRLGGQRPTPTRCATSAGPGRCSRSPAYGAGRRPTESARDAVRDGAGGLHGRGPRRRVLPGAQRAPPGLPPVPGRAHRVAAAGGHGREPVRRAPAGAGPGRPDPAQRPRPGGLPHQPRCELLERGDIEAAVAELDRAPRGRGGRDPRRALGDLGRTCLGIGRREVPDLAADQRRRPRRWPPGCSTASASTAPRPGRPRVADKLLPLLLVALILGSSTSFVKPIVKLLSIPFIIITLGLFLLVINALMLLLTGWLAGHLDIGFHVDGFWTAVGGAIVITLVTWVLDRPRSVIRSLVAVPSHPAARAAQPGPYRVALVCLGNICRSPMAARRARGAGRATPGSRPGRGRQLRHRRLARRRPDGPARGGHPDRGGLRRQPRTGPGSSTPSWSTTTTWCWPWTAQNLADCSAARTRPGESACSATSTPSTPGADVPDPYYGGHDGFEEVLAMVERTADALVAALARASEPWRDHADDPAAAGRPAGRGSCSARRWSPPPRWPAATSAPPPGCGSATARPR